MKLKHFLTLATLVIGGGSLWAQTDVTSTYITNADFEGSVTSYSKPKSDRDIYQPEGWSVSYTNGNDNDMTSLNSETTQWSQFSSKPQPTNGGSKAYWMRYRWGSSENITLSQETSSNLPAGTYCLSVDAYSDDNTGTVTISAAGVSQTVRANSAWANYKVVFSLASSQNVTVSLSYTNTAADDHAAAFDNVKILDLTEEPTGITLKNVLGGTTANLSDFNVWYDDYTLEAEGTAGTEISVAADNISYTPEATGAVRFVKKDGVVYVFEGTTYKTAVHSSKADYVYTAALTDGDNSTGNLLENGSFETLGDVLTADKAWKLGTPWVAGGDGFSWGNGSGGVRVSESSGTHRLLWRYTGNRYFSQQVTSVKAYKGYKMYVRQVASSNGFGDFRFGLGNAAGNISYLSANIRLGSKSGTDLNKIHEATFGASADIPVGGAYFSCLTPTSARNTADEGSTTDPLSQIDWIGLVGSDDFPITGVSSASYVYGTAYAPATAKSSYLAAKAEAESTIGDATYNSVTGEERSNLQTLIDADVEDNDAAYNTATENIQAAQDAFTAALTHYQALIDAQAAVPDLAYASATASAFKTALATSASDADEKVAAMTTDIRAYYESHALAKGVAGAVDKTGLIVNPNNPTNTNGWKTTNTAGDCKMRIMTNEPYTNADGTTATGYFDTNSWGTAFSSTFTQDVELPAGTYILTVRARGNGTTTYQVMADDQTADITAMGSTGGVFDRGWNDYTVEFTLATQKIVTLGINMVTGSSGNWLSFGKFRLVRIAFDAATTTEYTALNEAIAAKDGKTLGFEDGEYAPYNNVEVITALANANAVNQASENAKADIEALTDALNDATWTANSGDVDAIYNGNFSVQDGNDTQALGWTRTNAWGQMQNGAGGDNTNGTAYYNQQGSMQYGNAGLYTMPLKANTIYRLQFKYGAWDQNVIPTVSVLNESDGMDAMSFAATSTNFKTSMIFQDLVFVTGAAGNYVLTIAGDKNLVITGVSITKAASQELVFADGSVPTYAPGTYPSVKISRSLEANRWATAVYPFAVSGVDNIAVLDSYDASTGELGFATAAASTANKPFLMRSTAGASEISLSNVEVAAAAATDATASEAALKGAYTVTEIDNSAMNYVLSNNVIYSVGTAGATITPYRAYIQIAQSTPVKALTFFVDDTETTIEGINEENKVDAPVYNLAGQRVNKAHKGIYIINGKKVLVK